MFTVVDFLQQIRFALVWLMNMLCWKSLDNSCSHSGTLMPWPRALQSRWDLFRAALGTSRICLWNHECSEDGTSPFPEAQREKMKQPAQVVTQEIPVKCTEKYFHQRVVTFWERSLRWCDLTQDKWNSPGQVHLSMALVWGQGWTRDLQVTLPNWILRTHDPRAELQPCTSAQQISAVKWVEKPKLK